MCGRRSTCSSLPPTARAQARAVEDITADLVYGIGQAGTGRIARVGPRWRMTPPGRGQTGGQ
jgi:hypothetical protein